MHALALIAPGPLVEALSDTLGEELGALSVSLEDADADSPDEQALFGEPGMPPPQTLWPRSRVVALFEAAAEADDAARLLLGHPAFDGVTLERITEVPDEDWVRLTQSQFVPVAITPDFWIVPSWHQPPDQASQVIRLDPGLAFGTGTHPTTRMCLRWIAREPAPWPRVLDYGCGSGILAIGAARLGAVEVDAVDIDPAAVTATAANAQANGVVLKAGLPDLARGRYDLVMANILATPLRLLAPLLCGHLAPGGRLLLSGILARQAEELGSAYARWLRLEVADEEDGWILMTAEAAR